MSSKLVRILIATVVVIALAAAAWYTAPGWLPMARNLQERFLSRHDHQEPDTPEPAVEFAEESTVVKITPQAKANLGLTSSPARLQHYWQKIETTGVIVDRPGFTDQGVTTPVDGFVSKIYAYEGDIVEPGDKLFSLRLTSQYLQQTQSDFFKALRETEIIQSEIKRLTNLVKRGVIPEKRIIELEQELKRQKVEIQGHRQDLVMRGLEEWQLQQISDGEFIKSIEVLVPPRGDKLSPHSLKHSSQNSIVKNSIVNQNFLELQQLKVELGEKAQAGQLLAILADHNHLYINGHGFKNEAGGIAQAAEKGWPIDVEFIEKSSGSWPESSHPMKIRHMSNTVDLESRTFDFFIPLTNQSRIYEQDGRTFVIWRFRPGQRVRIQIPVKEMKNVFVIPIEAVVSEGPENFVFQQNGELFNRIEVHVVHRDRESAVIAADGGIRNGFYVANNSAAALNRILKAQSASGENMDGFHVHADGSVHANH